MNDSRSWFAGLLAVAGLLSMSAGVSAQTPKLGYIDSRRIIAEAPGAKEAQQAFEKDMDRFRTELKVLEDSLKNMISKYEQQQVTLSPDAKKRQEDAIRQQQRLYQDRAEALEEQAAKRQGELVEPIMAKINTVISELRKEGGYAVIFDAAGGALIAADPALDLTEQVLTRLKATASAPGEARKQP